MTQSYRKECIYCKEEITMSDETGKWLPYNKDVSAHDCRTTATNGQEQKFSLDEVTKKLESMGIIINVDRLMKE